MKEWLLVLEEILHDSNEIYLLCDENKNKIIIMMREEKEVENLLQHIQAIKKKYDDIAKITGEPFNIFEVLELSTNETRTHSAFLAELLNPKGKHGLGSILLKHFLKIIDWNEFDADNAKVTIELTIGLKSIDGRFGGRIDIILYDDKKNAIIIENKIYAVDQDKQLLRYFNYATKSYNNFKLLYLTLNGDKPSEDSTNKELIYDENYYVISYKETIKEWLEECKKEATSYPLLRETISQYLTLIRKLTNQSTNKIMSQEIIDIITHTEESYLAARKISTITTNLENNIREKCQNELLHKWKETYGDKPSLFTIDDYIIKVFISFESNYWHLNVTPFKIIDGIEKFGCANDMLLKGIRDILLSKYPGNFYNNNYIIWVKSNYNFDDNIKMFISLNKEENRKTWINNIIVESKNVISYLITNLDSINDYNNKINFSDFANNIRQENNIDGTRTKT